MGLLIRKKKTGDDAKEMPFLDHLEELRWRILKSLGAVVLFTCAAFPCTGWLLDVLTYPNTRLANPARLVFLKPTGMLMVRMEIALGVGLVAALPVILYQLWQFVTPGLLPKERRYILPTLFFTTVCFLLGAVFCYFVLIPIVLPFLFSMGTESIEAVININDYMSFVLRLVLMTGVVWELPVLSFFLSRIGLVTPKFLRKYRRHSIVIIFIVSAVVTPTIDPISQGILAVPLLLLYEISIAVSALGYSMKKKSDAEREKEFESETKPPASPAAPKPRAKPKSKPKAAPARKTLPKRKRIKTKGR